MRSRSARFDIVIAGPHVLATRVDVLYNRQTVISDISVVSGEVTYDRTAATMATGLVKVAEPTLLPTAADGGPLSPYGYELQVFRGLKYSDGTEDMMSLGVFGIQKSSFDGVTLQGDLGLLDRSKQIADAKFEEDYVIAVGTNAATAIRAIIEAGIPGLTFAFQSIIYTLPAIVFAAGDDRWDAARALAKAVGCEVYFDGYGRCVLRQEPGAQAEPALTISDGTGGNLHSITLDLDREPAYNRVIVTGENSSNSAVYRGVATDDDPSSPTAYGGPFGKKTLFYSSAAISSNEQAATVAQALLIGVSGVARTINVSFVPNPALEPGDIIEVVNIVEGLNINELYIVDGFTIGLGADALIGMGMAS